MPRSVAQGTRGPQGLNFCGSSRLKVWPVPSRSVSIAPVMLRARNRRAPPPARLLHRRRAASRVAGCTSSRLVRTSAAAELHAAQRQCVFRLCGHPHLLAHWLEMLREEARHLLRRHARPSGRRISSRPVYSRVHGLRVTLRGRPPMPSNEGQRAGAARRDISRSSLEGVGWRLDRNSPHNPTCLTRCVYEERDRD